MSLLDTRLSSVPRFILNLQFYLFDDVSRNLPNRVIGDPKCQLDKKTENNN